MTLCLLATYVEPHSQQILGLELEFLYMFKEDPYFPISWMFPLFKNVTNTMKTQEASNNNKQKKQRRDVGQEHI